MNKTRQLSQIKNYYNNRYSKVGTFRTRLKRYEQFLEPLELEQGRKLLDVGCGEGYVLQIAQVKGLSCYGIDISEKAVKICREKVDNALCEIIVGNGEDLPFEDAFFDYVTSIGSLEHFLNSEEGIREIVRVCRDDGKICIVVPNSFGFLHKLGIYKGTEQIQEKLATLDEWRSFLEESGIRIISVSRDRGPNIFKDAKPNKIVQRLLLRLTLFMPLCMAYQFIFFCQKK